MQTAQLESHEIFQLLRPEQMSILSAAAEEVSFEAGDTVFLRGEQADDFFVVLEGQVALRMLRPDGVSVLIDEVTAGVIFGSCVCFEIDAYSLTAMISRVYFKRYLDTMRKLQAIVQSIPLEAV